MFVLSLAPLLLLFYAMRYYRSRWRAGMEQRFQKALDGLQIGSHVLLVDKVTVPSTDITAEVYRILRDEQDRYFVNGHALAVTLFNFRSRRTGKVCRAIAVVMASITLDFSSRVSLGLLCGQSWPSTAIAR